MAERGQVDSRCCSLRNPSHAVTARLLRKAWFKKSSFVLVFVGAYICTLVLFNTFPALTSLMGPRQDDAPGGTVPDGISLASVAQKMRPLVDKLDRVDLSVQMNGVKFKKNKRKVLCFEWSSVKAEVEEQVRSEQQHSSAEKEKHADNQDEAKNEIVPNIIHFLGNTASSLFYPLQAGDMERNTKVSREKPEEPGLQYPVSPSASVLRALYRQAIKHAARIINNNVNAEEITSCAFPGFSQQESQAIWDQAVLGVRIQHSCRRYTGFKYLTDHEAIWAPNDNLGYCHHVEVGSNFWLKFLLDWGGEVRSAVADHSDLEARVRQLYPPLPDWRMDILQRRKPMLFTVIQHPLERIVSIYVNYIKGPYRHESRAAWIKDVRGKTYQELINGIKKNIVSSYPQLATTGTLNQLLIPAEGFGKFNKIRRHGNSTDPRLNFREFIWLVMKQNFECLNDIDCLSKVDRHWRPQHLLCSPCSHNFNMIIKEDSFHTDTNLLLKLLGKPLVDTTNSSSFATLAESSPNDAIRDVSNSSIVTNETQQDRGDDLYDIDEDKIEQDLPRKELTKQYISSLTSEELRMLYITYSYDFTIFGYNAVD